MDYVHDVSLLMGDQRVLEMGHRLFRRGPFLRLVGQGYAITDIMQNLLQMHYPIGQMKMPLSRRIVSVV